MNLRALAENDLAVTLEGDFGMPVGLIDPAGNRITGLKGQVLYGTARINPETGEMMYVDQKVVVLRRSSLDRVPLAGENWIVEFPVSPVAGASIGQYVLSPDRPPQNNESIGFIRLYPIEVEQSEVPEE